MREVITRRYGRLQEKTTPRPGLVLVDGGLGQLHAAAGALEELGITDQPLASIAKREEWIYVYGQEEEPVVLDQFSPVLHLVQMVRDEAHRFAVTFHRTRRTASRLRGELIRFRMGRRRQSYCASGAWNGARLGRELARVAGQGCTTVGAP